MLVFAATLILWPIIPAVSADREYRQVWVGGIIRGVSVRGRVVYVEPSAPGAYGGAALLQVRGEMRIGQLHLPQTDRRYRGGVF